jgi:DNA polymerase III delta subunit
MSRQTSSAQEFEPSGFRLGDNVLLLGMDAYLADNVADLVRIKLRTEYQADLVIIYGDEVKSAELNELLDTYTIFSQAKLVIIRNAHLFNKRELDALADYFDSPAQQQSLIITTEKVDARMANWKKIRDNCMVLACDPPTYGGMLKPWLTTQLRKIGKTMSQAAADTFISRIELDYAIASNELQKLDLLTGAGKQITEEDVLRSIGSSRVGTQIDFFRALGNLQPKNALELLERMLTSDWEDLQVFFLITKFYGLIYRMLLLKKNHISPAEIMNKHLNDTFPSQRQEFLGFSSNYRLEDMPRIYSLLLETDARLKTTAASGDILLSSCVLSIMGQ